MTEHIETQGAESVLWLLLVLGIDVVISIPLSIFFRSQANAAVAVRPELADATFIQAILTNHAMGWLWYNQSVIAHVVLVLVMFIPTAILVSFWSD